MEDRNPARALVFLGFLLWGTFFVEDLREWFIARVSRAPPAKVGLGQGFAFGSERRFALSHFAIEKLFRKQPFIEQEIELAQTSGYLLARELRPT